MADQAEVAAIRPHPVFSGSPNWHAFLLTANTGHSCAVWLARPSATQSTFSSGPRLVDYARVRPDLLFVELTPDLTYDERSTRGGFDNARMNQFLRSARLDQPMKRSRVMAFPRVTRKHRPRRLARLGHEVHLELNHIPQGVLPIDTHPVLCVRSRLPRTSSVIPERILIAEALCRFTPSVEMVQPT